MNTIEVIIDSSVKDKFPDVMIAGFRATNLRRAIAGVDVELLLKNACVRVANSGIDIERLSKHPIVEGWRQSYKLSGAKPSKFRSSIEALVRRSLRGESVTTPVDLVNFYNAVSLRHMAPLGAYDISKIKGDQIALRFANPEQDSFTPLGADALSFPLMRDLVVYALKNKILCWGFNCRDSAHTCLDQNTDEALFFTECAMAVHHDAARNVLEDLAKSLSVAGADCSSIQYTNDSGQPIYL